MRTSILKVCLPSFFKSLGTSPFFSKTEEIMQWQVLLCAAETSENLTANQFCFPAYKVWAWTASKEHPAEFLLTRWHMPFDLWNGLNNCIKILSAGIHRILRGRKLQAVCDVKRTLDWTKSPNAFTPTILRFFRLFNPLSALQGLIQLWSFHLDRQDVSLVYCLRYSHNQWQLDSCTCCRLQHPWLHHTTCKKSRSFSRIVLKARKDKNWKVANDEQCCAKWKVHPKEPLARLETLKRIELVQIKPCLLKSWFSRTNRIELDLDFSEFKFLAFSLLGKPLTKFSWILELSTFLVFIVRVGSQIKNV